MNSSSINSRYRFLRLSFLILFLGLAFGRLAFASDSSITEGESKLRAAIVLGILRFTSWPNDVSMSSTFDLCTVGKPLSEPALSGISGERTFQSITIVVKKLGDDIRLAKKCDALVIGGDINKLKAFQRLTRHDLSGVLTICDACDRKKIQAMVQLIRIENHIGFMIDMVEAKKHGLSFSSSMLELAIQVHQ